MCGLKYSISSEIKLEGALDETIVTMRKDEQPKEMEEHHQFLRPFVVLGRADPLVPPLYQEWGSFVLLGVWRSQSLKDKLYNAVGP